MPKIQKNKQLQDNNTFGLPCKAEQYVRIESTSELSQLSESQYQNAIILGWGSNVLLPDRIDRLIIHMQILGRHIEKIDTGYRVKIAAGESWDEIVRWSLEQKMYGLENLASIPGTVGASPVQNIGAYGKQVQDYIESVEVFDTISRTFHHISNQDCQFGYRESLFKKPQNKHLIIVAVVYLLSDDPVVDCMYDPVATILSERENPIPQDVYDIVEAVRASKLPDIHKYPNTGSTFKNPIIDKNLYNTLLVQYPDMPSYKQVDDRCKIPAGWLIDKAGWRWKKINTTIWSYDKQALVLYNIGKATQDDVIQAIQTIQESISQIFHIHIEPEVQIIPKP